MEQRELVEQEDRRRELSDVGFVVFKRLFSVEEISLLREAILQRVGVFQGGSANGFGRVETLAAFKMAEAADILSDPRIVRAASQLLGTARPTFTLHCDAHRNVLSDWHKDSGEGVRDGGYFGRNVFDLDLCPVVKFGIYCQDHVEDGAGLHVRPGSHRSEAIRSGSSQTLTTEVGDVVAFDVRISHLGEVKKNWHRGTERVFAAPPGEDQSRYSTDSQIGIGDCPER